MLLSSTKRKYLSKWDVAFPYSSFLVPHFLLEIYILAIMALKS